MRHLCRSSTSLSSDGSRSKWDESSGRLCSSVSPHHYDALVNVGVLAQVDVARLVAGDDSVNVIALREHAAFLLCRSCTQSYR